MKKNGFTLIELLAVIALIAVLGAATITMFSKNTSFVSSEDLESKYRQIQRAAVVYVDLNESWLSEFTATNEIYVKLGELQNTNYVNVDTVNPKTGEKFPSSYLIKIYTAKDSSSNKPYVETCILKADNSCVANSEGKNTNCCSAAACGNLDSAGDCTG